MNIGILSYNRRTKLSSRKIAKNERLLVDAAKARGHKARVFRADKCELVYTKGGMKLLYGDKPFPKLDVIISRPSVLGNLDIELTLNKHILLMGYKLVNGYMPILRAKNKIRTIQIMSHKGIPIPDTVVLRRLEYVDAAVKRVGGYPVIIKTPVGSFGTGVVLVESRRSLLSSLDILFTQYHWNILLIQQYIHEAQGKDVRVFVVNGKVVAAIERTSAEGDFRSNLHAGGSGVSTELTQVEIEISIKAAEVLGLEIAGVDLLRT
ncbi:MAG: RimK family alpha-L-glutamate ligase, partial [Candidatus Peregrinibacteria bacterium]|nr:RimK family alpha-L-glutamate ligase [Candidatus Peregrinibacteria bacterium]